MLDLLQKRGLDHDNLLESLFMTWNVALVWMDQLGVVLVGSLHVVFAGLVRVWETGGVKDKNLGPRKS